MTNCITWKSLSHLSVLIVSMLLAPAPGSAIITADEPGSAIAQKEFRHEQKIVALVDPYLTHKKVNALSVGVISNGQIWKKSFGILEADGTLAPNDKTLYEIGSISKVFT